MKLKKKIAGIMSAIALTASLSLSTFAAIPSLADTDVLIGDANGDGSVTASDAYYIQSYLLGNFNATVEQVTAMDVNKDKMIDNTDAMKITYNIAHAIPFNERTSTLLTLPSDTSVTYRKHTCSSTDSTQYTEYTLSAPASTSNINEPEANAMADFQNILEGDSINSLTTLSGELDESINCVKLYITDYNGNTTTASGFVVNNHVIATAAENLYSANSGFVKKVSVNVYNSSCSNVTTAVNSTTLHIPTNYATNANMIYNYGLIYVASSLPTSSISNMGVMTDGFISSNNSLTTSGFVNLGSDEEENSNWKRWKTSGTSQSLGSPYVFYSTAAVYDHQKGGMISYHSTATENDAVVVEYDSVVGITANDSSSITMGVRMTPTQLRFYRSNSNLS